MPSQSERQDNKGRNNDSTLSVAKLKLIHIKLEGTLSLFLLSNLTLGASNTQDTTANSGETNFFHLSASKIENNIQAICSSRSAPVRPQDLPG